VIKLISVRNFVRVLHSPSRRDLILLVIACSKKKRSDEEIRNIYSSFIARGKDLTKDSLKLDHVVIKSYRSCIEDRHPGAVKSTQKYPAFLRYSGIFYNGVWNRGGLEVWERVIRDGWKVLILSSYYGFLRVTDCINDYDLHMKEVSKECKEKLPNILKKIMEVNNSSEVYFLTSKEYVKPFKNKVSNAYRMKLYDKSGREVDGLNYYREVSTLFVSIITGITEQISGKVEYVELEKI